MRLILMIACLHCLLIPEIWSQATKQIQIHYQNSKILKEEYNVLVEEELIKHGLYQYYFKNEKVRLKGNYHLGVKDGVWYFYNDQGNPLTVEHYEKGAKVGIWLAYLAGGKIAKRFDYDQQKSLPPLLPNINVAYPARGREEEIEGMVELKFLLDDSCKITEVITLKTLGEEFEKEVVDGFIRLLNLCEKYDLKIAGCTQGEQIISVNFTLK